MEHVYKVRLWLCESRGGSSRCGSHVYTPPTRLPVCSGAMVQGSGAARTGKLPDGHIVSGGAGHIIVWYHWRAHRLQCPVGGVLPVQARGEGGDRVNVEEEEEDYL